MSIYVLLNVTFDVTGFISVKCHFQTCLLQIKPINNLKYSLIHHADRTFYGRQSLNITMHLCLSYASVFLFFPFWSCEAKKGKERGQDVRREDERNE